MLLNLPCHKFSLFYVIEELFESQGKPEIVGQFGLVFIRVRRMKENKSVLLSLPLTHTFHLLSLHVSFIILHSVSTNILTTRLHHHFL